MTLSTALAAYEAALEANPLDVVLAESDLFAEALTAGWPGLDASHVQWAREEVVRQAMASGDVVDFAAMPHRLVQWIAYESDGHPLAEDAYDWLDALPYPSASTPLIITAPPSARRIA